MISASARAVTWLAFGILYHRCSVKEFLQKLNGNFSFQQHDLTVGKQQNENKDGQIKIISSHAITSLSLCRYLHKRKIPLEIAEKFCREVYFELYNKQYAALGFFQLLRRLRTPQ